MLCTFGKEGQTSGNSVLHTFGKEGQTSGNSVLHTFGKEGQTSGNSVLHTFGKEGQTSGNSVLCTTFVMKEQMHGIPNKIYRKQTQHCLLWQERMVGGHFIQDCTMHCLPWAGQ